MTPLPKRRHSSARQSKRTRALTSPYVGLVACSKCHALRLPHRVCDNCGFYNDQPVIIKKAAKA